MQNIRYSTLPEQLLDFMRFLRTQGFTTGPSEAREVFLVLNRNILSDPQIFREALKCLLSKNKDQYELFDKLFHQYWKTQKDMMNKKENDKTKPGNKKSQSNKEAQFKALKDWLQTGNPQKQQTEVKVYSEIGSSEKLDLQALDEAEFDKLLYQLKRKLQKRKQKMRLRFRTSVKGVRLDLKKSIEASMPYEGEIIYLYKKKYLPKKRKVFIIGDISRSMELYTVHLLKFFYALKQMYQPLYAFVFSTDIKEVSNFFHLKDIKEMLKKLQTEVDLWHGGTRTGISLRHFLDEKGYQKLDKNAVVIILSDGIDTGQMNTLADSLFQIKKQAAKLIWLNPLLANPQYRPESKGMKTALPFLDALLPCHNFESLQKVLEELEN